MSSNAPFRPAESAGLPNLHRRPLRGAAAGFGVRASRTALAPGARRGSTEVLALGGLLLACVCLALVLPSVRTPAGEPQPDSDLQQGEPSKSDAAGAQALEALVAEFGQQGITLALDQGWCAITARILARYQPLEYVLVGPRGQAHEALFGTEVRASALNAAVLLFGIEPGQNARWVELPPGAESQEATANDGAAGPGGDASGADDREGGSQTVDEGEQTAPPRRRLFRIEEPVGDGLYLYAGWKSEGEAYFFRVEDLLANTVQERGMRRHRFVYLGSRWVEPKPGAELAFAADLEQNLINLVFFSAGSTLFTAAVPEARDEDAWFANPWLLPEADQPVCFVLSRSPINGVSPELLARLPESKFPVERR